MCTANNFGKQVSGKLATHFATMSSSILKQPVSGVAGGFARAADGLSSTFAAANARIAKAMPGA